MNPWIILGVVIAWGLSLFGVGKWQRHDGAAGAELACTTEKNVQLSAANVTIKRMQDEARERERLHREAVAKIGDEHDAEKAKIEARRVADVRAANFRVRVPAPACNPGAGAVPDPRPGSGVRDETQVVELPREIGADLRDLANDADEVVVQLTACQKIVASDRVLDAMEKIR